jgi:hypothetical protein
MDGESEADTQRAEAGRAEANVKREGLGSHEPARAQRNERPATGYGEPEAGAPHVTPSGPRRCVGAP